MVDKRRLAIFAHYDKDNVIDDYVIYYLQELKKSVQKIIFVSDSDLPSLEKNKLADLADFVLVQKHGEYDFGSYKRGFLYALDNNILNDFDECIFANDSCYGPFYPFSKVFEKMDGANYDFWSITKNEYGFDKKKKSYYSCRRPHLQSYFLLFKKNVFTSDEFVKFINLIKKENNKYEIIINYEIGLSEKLMQAGFIGGCFVKSHSDENASVLYSWEDLILNCEMPFLKCSIPRLKYQSILLARGYEKTIQQVSDYPIDLIKKNAYRTQAAKELKIPLPVFVKKNILKIFYIIKMMVKEIRYFLSKF